MGYRTGIGGYGVGDPFLGSVLKGIGKAAGGVLRTVGGIVGGPAGGVLGAVGGIISPTRPAATALPTLTGISGGIQLPAGLGFTGGATFGPAVGAGVPAGAPGDDGCPKGYHRNRSDYFTKREGYVPRGSKCVRNRTINPANGRALRKALRREESFIRVARRSGLVALPKATRTRRKARGKS